MPVLLAIESSCDETAAAVCKDGQILSNIIATQQVHVQFGGVVPELAAGGTTVFAGNYSFLREINYTSALVEMGFMSNRLDEAALDALFAQAAAL